MKRNSFDDMIDSFVDQERSLSPNPFLATRVMASINSQSEGPGRYSTWSVVAIAFSFLAAVGLGIKAGTLYSPAPREAATVVLVSDDQAEHFIFYQQNSNE